MLKKRRRLTKKLRYHVRTLNNSTCPRLNWKQMEREGGTDVIKGLSHRVIVVKSPNSIFEEAIFVIRDDMLAGKGADSAAIIKEARRAANSYIKSTPKQQSRLFSRLPAPFFAAAGAAATGIAWLALRLCGV